MISVNFTGYTLTQSGSGGLSGVLWVGIETCATEAVFKEAIF
jgi:hypothetical protein